MIVFCKDLCAFWVALLTGRGGRTLPISFRSGNLGRPHCCKIIATMRPSWQQVASRKHTKLFCKKVMDAFICRCLQAFSQVENILSCPPSFGHSTTCCHRWHLGAKCRDFEEVVQKCDWWPTFLRFVRFLKACYYIQILARSASIWARVDN